MSPTCPNTKLVHIVGLTEVDTKKSVFKAISKPGRNHAIAHLVNPCSLRILEVKPCKKKPHVFRATAVMSDKIHNILVNKMNSKICVDFISCSVFTRPDSIRCVRCQRLGHSAHTCTNELTCANCGGNHETHGCTNAPKCINCFSANIQCDHRADSPNCDSYKNYRKGPSKN